MMCCAIHYQCLIFALAFTFPVTTIWVTAARGQEAADESAESAGGKYQAVTTTDPTIPTDELALLLRPLTKNELKAELEAWLDLLKAKTAEISQAELVAKRADTPLTETAESAPADADEETQATAVGRITELRSEQTALVDRTKAVMSALTKKGGDASEYETYVNAVAGIASVSSDWQSLTSFLIGWLKSPEGGVQLANRFGIALLILFTAWVISKFVGHAAGRAVGIHAGISDLLKDFTTKMAGRLVLLIGLIMAIAAMGVEIGPMLAAIGAGGFILAFALQESIGNFAAGLMIMLYRPFDTGNFVDVDGVNGTVQRVSLASTHLLTPDNKLVILPNNKVLSGVITNANGSSTRRVDLVFGIGYDDDIGRAIRILEQLVDNHPDVLKDPATTIKVGELGASSVNLICRPWVNAGDYWTVYWDLLRGVKERFDQEGISIPYPQQDVHIHNVAATS